MKKALLLLGAAALVCLLLTLSGCILETTTVTIVVTDYVCTGFTEDHDSENYMDESETIDDSFFLDLDTLLQENDLTKDDVVSAEVLGAFYQVTSGPSFGPWDVSGSIYVSVDGGPHVLVATYQIINLSGPMTDPVRIDTYEGGLDVLNAAIDQYLSADNPAMYPEITFYADRETGDIDPSPTPAEPFQMTWNGCLSMRVDFTEQYDVYDMFPGS